MNSDDLGQDLHDRATCWEAIVTGKSDAIGGLVCRSRPRRNGDIERDYAGERRGHLADAS